MRSRDILPVFSTPPTSALNWRRAARSGVFGAMAFALRLLITGALLVACSHAKPSCNTPGLPLLDDLGRKRGTDKSTTNHAFLPIYSRALESIRQSATRVMEVGVFYGSSILMWRDYFTKAEVVGVDPFAGLLGHGVRFPQPRKFLELWQQGKAGERIKLIEADQSDTSHLERTVRELQPGGSFDMIIDDGSHKHRDQQQTMGYLLPLLKPGGVYIIEDIHTSLQPRYDQPRLGNKTTLMMVERWQGGLPIHSPFMSEEQQVQRGHEMQTLFHPLTCGRSPHCIYCSRLHTRHMQW